MSGRHETDLVPSPGGWDAPAGARPGWNWAPPFHGMQPAPERMPWWVRIWYRLPLVDRYAHEWMWFHGGFLVLPADHPFQGRNAPDEYEALTGISKAEYERRCVESARAAFAPDDNRPITDAVGALEGDGDGTELVVRFRIEGHAGRTFGDRIPLWPSPHPDDYEGAPEWAEILPSLLRAAIEDPAHLAGEADANGVTWI